MLICITIVQFGLQHEFTLTSKDGTRKKREEINRRIISIKGNKKKRK